MGTEIYSYELKLKVVIYVLEEGHSHKEAAEHFGVTLYPVEKWVNLYKCHGEKGLESRNRWNRAQTFTGEFKMNVLKYMEENRRLQMENDYLKKLNALVREKEKSAKKNG